MNTNKKLSPKWLVFSLVAGVWITSAMADTFTPYNPIQNLISHSEAIHQMIMRRAGLLNPIQQREIGQLLTQIDRVLLGNAVVVTPSLPPVAVLRSCENEDPNIMRETFMQVKQFAYASEGLNMDEAGSTTFAQQWTQSHGCNDAAEYVREGRKIRSFAYGSTGLNKDSGSASAYVLQVMNLRCFNNVDYVAEGSKFHNFAYSSQGLNMDNARASEYTRQKMEARFFNCRH